MVALPGVSDLLTNAGSWATELFTSLVLVAAAISGLLIAGVILSKLIRNLMRGTRKVFGR